MNRERCCQVHRRAVDEATGPAGCLTANELAEAYARGIIEQYGIHSRLQPANGAHPDSPPAKKGPLRCVVQGSDFDRMVRVVDVAQPIPQGPKLQLKRLGL